MLVNTVKKEGCETGNSRDLHIVKEIGATVLALECLQSRRVESVTLSISSFIHRDIVETEFREVLTLEIMESMVEKWAAHDLQP